MPDVIPGSVRLRGAKMIVGAAAMILFLLLFFPFRSVAPGMVSVAITTMLLFFANFVLTDLDIPFKGTWNLGSARFAELVTKFR